VRAAKINCKLQNEKLKLQIEGVADGDAQLAICNLHFAIPLCTMT
jgi:hypothetical protein